MVENAVSKTKDAGHPHEALVTLAEYLEQSLDADTSIVMLRHTDGICTVYRRNPSGDRQELRQISSIDILLANSMLELTRSGLNHMTISDQEYRFVRSFTAFGDTAAIVFSTD